MKSKITFLFACLVILNSCIVKSLNPFYIPEAIKFQQAFLGEWQDDDKGVWKIVSVKQAYLQETREDSKTNKEDLEKMKKYGKGYFVSYVRKEQEALFLAMPFIIEDEVFMDFVPYHYDSKGTNDLVSQHLLKTHSVAKFKVVDGKNLEIIWLDEDRLETLFKENKIKIKHEKVGFDESLLLTASSEELYHFLKKYNASDVANKWKSDEKFTLIPVHAKP